LDLVGFTWIWPDQTGLGLGVAGAICDLCAGGFVEGLIKVACIILFFHKKVLLALISLDSGLRPLDFGLTGKGRARRIILFIASGHWNTPMDFSERHFTL
jgi:hypothetical protein